MLMNGNAFLLQTNHHPDIRLRGNGGTRSALLLSQVGQPPGMRPRLRRSREYDPRCVSDSFSVWVPTSASRHQRIILRVIYEI